jgi:Protein of unknown function (DUF3800)
MNPIVAFDESGNTGPDLLHINQPVFTLASVCLTDEEAMELISIASSKQSAKEIHFVNLKRRESGKNKIISILGSELIRPDKIKVSFFHKGFMVIAKIVDLLIENLAHMDGINIRERGANIALSNLIFYVTPVFCGKELFEKFQKYFVIMIRERTDKSVRDFYNITEDLYENCIDENYKSTILSTILASQFIIKDILADTDTYTLDPAIPAFVEHCSTWGDHLERDFDLIHDRSKPLKQHAELLSLLMIKDEPRVTVGFDRRKHQFPLRSTGINFCDSKDLPQLQIADIFAGACTYWASGLLCYSADKNFSAEIGKKISPLIINAIWPTPAVTPEKLGTEEIGGVDDVDYLTDLLCRRRKK